MSINPSLFVTPHLFTLYTKLFSVNFSQSLIDVFLIQGPLFIIKLSVAIFKLIQDDLMRLSTYEGQQQIIKLCENIKLSKLLKAANFTVNYVDIVDETGLEIKEFLGITIPNQDEGKVITEKQFWDIVGKIQVQKLRNRQKNLREIALLKKQYNSNKNKSSGIKTITVMEIEDEG